jgi:hypothetical protein
MKAIDVDSGTLNKLLKALHWISQSSQHPFFWMWLLHQNDTVGHISKRRICFTWLDCPLGARPLLLSSAIRLRHTTLCRTSLDRWSARHRDLYLRTHNAHKRKTSIFLSEFEPAISWSDRLQTHTSNRAVTGIDPQAEIIIVKWPVLDCILIYNRWLCTQ